MHKIRALCPLIRTETLQKATPGRGECEQLRLTYVFRKDYPDRCLDERSIQTQCWILNFEF